MRDALLAVAFAISSATAAPVPKDFKKPDDKKQILGHWVIERAIVDGKVVTRFNLDHSLIFRADGTVKFEYPKGETPQYADWTLDPNDTPKRLRWKLHMSENSFSHRYKFRDGRLVLARSEGLKAVPDDLAPGPGLTLIEYNRATKK